MINISKNRNLAPIAIDWAADLIVFLTVKLPNKNKVIATYNGNPRKVNKRLIKYAFMFGEKCRCAGIPKREWKSVWLNLVPYLTHSEKLIASPTSLETEKDVSISDNENIKNAIKETCIAVYTDFAKLHAYKYMEKLKIRTCPYCNRHYTFTVKNTSTGFSTRPEYDHYYDKSTYPHLALAFYNLIPSCKECNHNKRTKQLRIHPYGTQFESNFVITNSNGDEVLDLENILALQLEKDFSIKFRKGNIGKYSDPNTEEIENITTFGLEDLYNGHKDYVLELIEKRNSYDLITREGIVDGFQGIFHTQGEVFEFIWGRYLEENTFEKQPLSKFTHDILIQLGLLK